MKRIGIIGGTFDPVHNGHLMLGKQAYMEYGLDEIWFMPSHIPPHKKDHIVTEGRQRLDMLYLALEGSPCFRVSEFEMERDGNTYTAQTFELLKKMYPEICFSFIIGADSLFQIESWYHPEKVMAMTTLMVSGREYESGGITLEMQADYLRQKYQADIRFLHNKEMDISSAEIRKKAAEGKDITGDVPDKVREYILLHDLYKTRQHTDVGKGRDE